ncbi:hypothetical protein V6N11_070152 [Hibiscus sabdariffa]|uniref:Uncharacterized protein n=1 Tax=Hibiscus sabdariffa TaxID=183260 RepID=A0ABR2QE89_9ROSI
MSITCIHLEVDWLTLPISCSKLKTSDMKFQVLSDRTRAVFVHGKSITFYLSNHHLILATEDRCNRFPKPVLLGLGGESRKQQVKPNWRRTAASRCTVLRGFFFLRDCPAFETQLFDWIKADRLLHFLASRQIRRQVLYINSEPTAVQGGELATYSPMTPPPCGAGGD